MKSRSNHSHEKKSNLFNVQNIKKFTTITWKKKYIYFKAKKLTTSQNCIVRLMHLYKYTTHQVYGLILVELKRWCFYVWRYRKKIKRELYVYFYSYIALTDTWKHLNSTKFNIPYFIVDFMFLCAPCLQNAKSETQNLRDAPQLNWNIIKHTWTRIYIDITNENVILKLQILLKVLRNKINLN